MWNPIDLGKLAGYAGIALVDGTITGKAGDTFEAGDMENSPYTLTLKFRIMEPEKDLFAQTFKSNDYESLHRYTHRLIYAVFLDMNEKGQNNELGRDEKMLLDMHCEESIYATVKWSCRELTNTPEEMAALLIDAMPDKLKSIYSRYLDE